MMHLEELTWRLTAGFTRAPIMRPHPWCTVLHVSLWAALVLTLNADSEDSGCSPHINVRRHTAYETSPGQELVINCTVEFCSKLVPTVTWFKLLNKTSKLIIDSSSSHITTEWREFNASAGTWILIFPKILSNDSGLYRCQMGNDVSHSINVSVHGDGEHTTENNTTNETSNPEALKPMWMYMSSAAGIVGFVTVVIFLTVISMRLCKWKSKKGTQSECQHATIPMVQRPLRGGAPPPGPRASPSAPPSRLSAPIGPRPDELTSPRDLVYSKVKKECKRKRKAAEDGSDVVYAALNHQLPPGAAARPRGPEECSEYAAIRVA